MCGAWFWIRLVRVVRLSVIGTGVPAVPGKPCGLTQHIAVQLLKQSVKQQQSFLHSNCSNEQYSVHEEEKACKNKFEKRFRITASDSFGFEITASGPFVVQDSTCRSFWYRLDFNNERIRKLSEFLWFLRIRVVCYHVAKLHTTMWQSPIKVAGADHAV